MTTKQLQRTTFSTSRLLDFASAKELTAQTGHAVDDWPLVLVKELLDNAIDACEEAGIAPVIAVEVDDDGILVSDNGPGLPASTIEGVLDFSIRVSSREAYVSPTRGAQGNALKTIVSMPFVLSDGERGEVEIAARGSRHCIAFQVDRVRQAPVLDHEVVPADCNSGTAILVRWVPPAALGSIGREHFEARFAAAGCEMESFDYRKIADHDDDGIPCIIETAFGWLGDKAEPERRLVTGVNWSPGIHNPFRTLGSFGMSLDSILSRQRVDADEPVTFVLHAAYPRVEYLDRGKSSVVVRS